MRVLLLVGAVACGHGEPAKQEPPAPAKVRVEGYCSFKEDKVAGAEPGKSAKRYELAVMLAMDGTETMTADGKTRRTGERSPMRVLVKLDCAVTWQDGESLEAALADKRESTSCANIYLPLQNIDRGEGISLLFAPESGRGERIQSVSSDFGSITVGRGKAEDLHLTGFRRAEGSPAFNTRGVHLSWEYATAGSRVSLAADCPAS
jgi:hypothetical protein